jgi:phosphoglycerate dehydrogenase-like enzyme
MSRPTTVLAMQPALPAQLFDQPALDRLTALADVDPGLVLTEYGTAQARAALAGAEVLLTCWGAPTVDAAALSAAPRLRAIIHAAGSIKSLVGPECWERGILVSSGADANAVPVAEYTIAMILLAGKRVFAAVDAYHRAGSRPPRPTEVYGNYGRTVGILGASRVGRRVLELLAPFDFEPLVCDPFLDDAAASALGARLVGLDELCVRSEILSLHAPNIPATQHMIGPAQLAALPDGATVINTARGAILDHDALLNECETGRISAILDVTEPEPLPADSLFYQLRNVLVTPHVAGAQGTEIGRLGKWALDELERYGRGEPLAHEIRAAQLEYIA